MAIITVNKTRVDKEKGVVILSLKEYQRLIASSIPTHYLTGKAAKDLDKQVEGALKEYKAGKSKTIKSLADLR